MKSGKVMQTPGRRLQIIQDGWRPVCKKRARKLERRGEKVVWFRELPGYAWLPGGQRSRV